MVIVRIPHHVMNMAEPVEMTIQDGLSELKLIAQKLARNNDQLGLYSSKRKGEDDKIEDQKDYVKGLIQSQEDLLTRWTNIKTAIAKSNLETSFEFESRTYTIAEALLHKQGLLELRKMFLQSLSDKSALQAIEEYSNQLGIGTGNMYSRSSDTKLSEEQLEALKLTPKLFYSEKWKQDELDHLLELRSHLDRLIDKSNHLVTITI